MLALKKAHFDISSNLYCKDRKSIMLFIQYPEPVSIFAHESFFKLFQSIFYAFFVNDL